MESLPIFGGIVSIGALMLSTRITLVNSNFSTQDELYGIGVGTLGIGDKCAWDRETGSGSEGVASGHGP